MAHLQVSHVYSSFILSFIPSFTMHHWIDPWRWYRNALSKRQAPITHWRSVISSPPPKKGDLNCTSTRAWKPAVSPWIWPRFAPSTSRIHKGLQSFCFTLLTEMALKAITTLQQGVSESQQPDCTVKVALLVVSSSINIANIIQNLWKRASLLLVSIIEIHGYADPSIDPRIPQHRDMISVTSQWKTTTFEFRGAETCSISQIFCCQIGKKPRIC